MNMVSMQVLATAAELCHYGAAPEEAVRQAYAIVDAANAIETERKYRDVPADEVGTLLKLVQVEERIRHEAWERQCDPRNAAEHGVTGTIGGEVVKFGEGRPAA